jgi:predicted transcriptional regulator
MSTTVTLPDSLHAEVRALAERTGRTVEEVVAETIAQGLADERWFREEVEQGMRSAQEGPLLAANQVWDDLLRRGLLTPEAITQAEGETEGGLSAHNPAVAVAGRQGAGVVHPVRENHGGDANGFAMPLKNA